jgi:GcrA cell cycle regulator
MKEADQSWSDERVEALKTMWTEGKSASHIAKELGGVTRNAVIGKVHRLGLSNRGQPAPQRAERDEPRTPAAPRPVSEPAKPAVPVSAKPLPVSAPPPRPPKPIFTAGQPLPPQPSANEVSAEALANLVSIEKKAKKLDLMQLTERTCKWPIGDPATTEFWFCGHPTQAGKPYCEAHVAVAFQPMSSRRDRRASGR